MRAAVFSDVHGNLAALDAVLDHAAQHQVDEHWVVGDLVAHGPQPHSTIRRLMALPDARIVRGNTDRYVLRGDLPDLLPSLDRPRSGSEVRAVLATASAHAWTRGCVTAVGGHAWLAALPVQHRLVLPDGTRVLLVHASPGRDDGPGITEAMTDDELRSAGWLSADADLIFVGHTHRPLDRMVGTARVVNLGSVSVPLTPERGAMWTLLDADTDGYTIERKIARYDLEAFFTALADVHHPSAEWLTHKIRSSAAG